VFHGSVIGVHVISKYTEAYDVTTIHCNLFLKHQLVLAYTGQA